MPRLEGIAPIVPVQDEGVTLAFYRDVLGFEVRVHAPENRYALVARDEAAVALLGGADAAALRATASNISAYIWVADLDALWAELEPALAALPKGRVRAPFVQGYGMREFHVKDPDGFLIFFGEDAGG
ncbi:MAG: VOC family protein [Pseudomonadota bacterium]